MAATNAMIFSLDCILYSKLPRSLYKPLFHTLYWLDGCCMANGCDTFGGGHTLRGEGGGERAHQKRAMTI